MNAARELVERAAHGSSEHTYGVNTGFGRFVAVAIPEEQTAELQLRLLRSPRVRRRRPVSRRGRPRSDAPARECARKGQLRGPGRDRRAAARAPRPRRPALRAEPGLGRRLAATSPRSRISRCRSSAKGEAWIDGERLSGADALARAGLEPVQLEAKEGLSLVNGTQFMAAMLALGLVRARRLARAADIACALSSRRCRDRARRSSRRSTSSGRCEGRRPPPRTSSALLEGSAIIEAHRWCDKVQDAYSLRCAPQVHGASRDLLDYAEYTVASS